MRSTTDKLRKSRKRPLCLAPGVKPPIFWGKIDRQWIDMTTLADLQKGTLRRYQLSWYPHRDRTGRVLILTKASGWSMYDLHLFQTIRISSDYARQILADPTILDMERVL